MIRYTLTTILFSSLLISCGSDDKKDEPVANEFVGRWKTPCFIDDSEPDNIKYTITKMQVTEKTIKSQYTLYPTSTCENKIISFPIVLTYTLGEKSNTISGDEVRNIDITIQRGDVVLDIFKIEQSYLYFGEFRDDGLRSDTIDFTSWYEKQY